MTAGLLLAAALVALTGAPAGTNELHPRWSPSGRYLSLERDDGTSRTIEIYAADGTRIAEVALRPAGGAGYLLEEAAPAATFNAWLAWAPDERRFAFVSNGGRGAYDLYLGELPAESAAGDCAGAAPSAPRCAGPGGGTARVAAAAFRPLTRDAAADGQVAWSPTGDRLAFVSGRTDRGDLYLLDLATGRLTRLTAEGRSVLHPEWSPDGRRLAFALGQGDNHDICVIDDVDREPPVRRCVVVWAFDDLRPRWSPDGRRLAFYSSYNPDGEPAVWSLFTIAADGSEPAKGEGLLARRLDTGVVVDLEVGPAWTPDGRALLYVKRVAREFNPLYFVEVATGVARRLETGQAIHHDVSVARDGRLALRAQLGRWDRVLVGRLDALLAGGDPRGTGAVAGGGEP
ncbi:MAG TPA: hypothetical protein VNM66_04910, partial [Thermodesulfobacteriota bacterium]|nr:hypothetical protein [Thermodesulfobacteriota bacterium]